LQEILLFLQQFLRLVTVINLRLLENLQGVLDR